ncbi:MAG: zinc-ribbon domain-containing protein [Abditibacteriota bacterium]|nr:zinc-ribbon domain-containing protein [Abditibacteriota bacterium]
MKCLFCGFENPDTAKFCNECGAKLTPAEVKPTEEIIVSPAAQESSDNDFFDAWRYYETGEYELSLELARSLAEKSPDSSSIHSLMALIYEKKADRARLLGSRADSDTFLYLAIAEYERILEINPASEADKEKLKTLRDKVSFSRADRGFFANLIEKLKAVPVPVWAGIGAFLLVAIIMALALPKGEKETVATDADLRGRGVETEVVTPETGPTRVRTRATHDMPSDQTLRGRNTQVSNQAQVDAVRRLAEEFDPNNKIKKPAPVTLKPVKKPEPAKPKVSLEVEPMVAPEAAQPAETPKPEPSHELIPSQPAAEQPQQPTTASKANDTLREATGLYRSGDMAGARAKAAEARSKFEQENTEASKTGKAAADSLIKIIDRGM